MIEKGLEVHGRSGSMALGLVDLEKPFDTVPTEMMMATIRWLGVPEAEVRMVEGMYEKTTARVVVGEEASEEFDFEEKIGLGQGSVLSPSLFIAVLDLIGRKTVMKDAMKKLFYADNLALVANGKQELQETLESLWNGLFTRHGLKVTEDGSVAHRPPEGRAGHRAGGEETDSGGQFRVSRKSSVQRREDAERERERGAWKSTGRRQYLLVTTMTSKTSIYHNDHQTT